MLAPQCDCVRKSELLKSLEGVDDEKMRSWREGNGAVAVSHDHLLHNFDHSLSLKEEPGASSASSDSFHSCSPSPSPSPTPSTSTDFRAIGDTFLATKHYAHAIDSYRKALTTSLSLADRSRVHLAIATCYQAVEKFRSAHKESTRALQLLENDSNSILDLIKATALHSRGEAELGMKLFSRASKSFDAALLELGATGDFESEASWDVIRGKVYATRCLEQAKSGSYNWKKLYSEGLNIPKFPRQIIGDFIGPIAVQRVEKYGGGRGVFAIRDILPGELLLVEKAFAMAQPPGSGSKSLHLSALVLKKVLDDPSLTKIVYSLYGGEEFPPPLDVPEVLTSDLEVTVSLPIDVPRIRKICSLNCFASSPIRPTGIVAEDHEYSFLFILASLFNHSCSPNSYWSTRSDIMVLRSNRHISFGEEIFLGYNNETLHSTRSKELLHHIPSGCQCSQCQLDELDGTENLLKRDTLCSNDESIRVIPHLVTINREKGSPISPETLFKPINEYIEDLQATYLETRGTLRPSLHEAFKTLSEAKCNLETIEGVDAGALAGLEALRSTGAIITLSSFSISSSPTSQSDPTSVQEPVEFQVDAATHHPSSGDIGIALLVSGAYLKLDKRKAKMWIRLAMELERIGVGSGKELFKVRYEKTLKKYGVEELFESL